MITRPIIPPTVLKPLESVAPPAQPDANPGVGQPVESFESVLGKALNGVNDLQNQAATLDAKLASGQLEYIHQAMIMAEKANIALSLTVQIRNKVLEAYQEISRSQI